MDLNLLKLNIENNIPFGGKCIKLFGFHFIGCILSTSWYLFSDSPLPLVCGWIVLVGGNGMGCKANGAEHDHPLTPGPAEQRDQMATVLPITLAAAEPFLWNRHISEMSRMRCQSPRLAIFILSACASISQPYRVTSCLM